LAREADLEDASSTVSWIGRRRSAHNIDRLAFSLAGVVDGDRALVLRSGVSLLICVTRSKRSGLLH
jgi:hypothetical protein